MTKGRRSHDGLGSGPLLVWALSLALTAWAAAETGPGVVRLRTADGVTLEADYAKARGARQTLVLLHGVAASRREWRPLVENLSEDGYGSLAVDFRGHGGSGGPPFSEFRSEEDWRKLLADAEAAVDWLDAQGVAPGNIVLCGASIGANVAFDAAMRRPQVSGVCLLSPGMDYRGVTLFEPAGFGRRAFVAASRADDYAFQSSRLLVRRLKAGRGRATFFEAAAGHGMQMYGPRLWEELRAWLKTLRLSSSGRRASP